jgi:uncharacterized protein (TIGR02452 family)
LPAKQLLKHHIERVLEVARVYQYETLILGVWGCSACGGDSADTAANFLAALEGEFLGFLYSVMFAITEWSLERRFRSTLPRNSWQTNPITRNR